MPVIPAFGQFAPKPTLAGAYGAGVGAIQEQQKIGQAADRIAIEAQQAANDYRIKKEQLANARMIAQQETDARLAIASQEAQESSQRLMVDKAYKDAQISLSQSELEQAKARQDEELKAKATLAAQQLAAQNDYSQAYQRNLDSGMDATEAAVKAALSVPSIVTSGRAAPLVNAWERVPAPFDPGTIKQYDVPGTGHAIVDFDNKRQLVPVPGSGGQGNYDRLVVSRMLEDRSTLQKQLTDPYTTKEQRPEIEKKLSDVEDGLKSFGVSLKGKAAPKAAPETPAAAPAQAPAAAAPIPLPKSKADLKAGTTYQTARGPATWDGEKFTLQ